MNPATPKKPKLTSGTDARTRIVHAAIELFGAHGYDGTSIRDIARKAGQNIGSISYYFGDKKGLYTAIAEDIADYIQGAVGERLRDIEAKLDSGTMTADDHVTCLQQLVTGTVTSLCQQDKLGRSISQIFAHEQIAPTGVLHVLCERVHKPVQEMGCRLLGGYLGEDPASEAIMVRSYTLFGGALIFRLAREMVLLRTGWKTLGDREIRLVSEAVSENITFVLHGLRKARASGAFR